MLSNLILSLEKKYVSEYIYKIFKVENEIALKNIPSSGLHPLDHLVTIIHKDDSYKLGQLPWGRKTSPFLTTLDTSLINQSSVFKKHLEKKRCLVLINAFEISSEKGQPSIFSFKHSTDQPLLLAGLYFTTIVNKVKSTHVTLLITDPPAPYALNIPSMPVILNPDQYYFWLNPKTIVPELNFLFLSNNYKNLILQSK